MLQLRQQWRPRSPPHLNSGPSGPRCGAGRVGTRGGERPSSTFAPTPGRLFAKVGDVEADIFKINLAQTSMIRDAATTPATGGR